MPIQIDTATDYLDLLDRVRRFAVGYGVAGTPAFTGTGDGTMTGVDTHPATITETWTITVTDATTPGSEVWSVSGSVSGAQASATTGVPYDNGLLAFTITAGGVNFAASDQFTVATTQGDLSAAGTPWIEDEWDGSTQLIMHAPGLGGGEAIYCGLRAFESVASDYYNWELRGYTGYNSGLAFGGHPGASPASYVHLWQSAIPYWLTVNGQRLVLVAKISTVYETLYAGKINPYGTPGQYPYPLFVAGTSNDSTLRWSSTSSLHASLQQPSTGSAHLLQPNAAWLNLVNISGSVLQWAAYLAPNAPNNIRDNIDGSYTLIPYTLAKASPETDLFGELDGVAWVSGFGQASEDTITIGADTWLVVQNVFRTGAANYMAIKQE